MIRGGEPVMFASAATNWARLVTVKTLAGSAAAPPVVPGGEDAQPSLRASVSRPMSVVKIGPDAGVHASSAARTRPATAAAQARITRMGIARDGRAIGFSLIGDGVSMRRS